MKDSYDVIVIGAGPAGMSAAGYAARAGHDVLLLDAAAPGGQLMFIDQIENYPGFESISGFALAEKMESQAASFGVEVEYGEVTSVKQSDGGFIVSTGDGDVLARAVILAMGARHRHLEVPGEEEYSGRGVSYCATCDGPFFKGRRVVVVGGGDTALTDAVYLSRLCSSVKVVHRRNEFRAQKAIQDKMRACANIQTVTPHTVKEILGDGEKVTGVVLDDGSLIETDGIFIFTGILPNSQIVKDLVELDEAGFVRTDSMMRTSLEGVYAVGDLRTTPFRQVVTAAGDGAVAAHMADEYLNR